MEPTVPKKPNPVSEPAPVPDEPPHMIGYARVSKADQDPAMQRDALIAAGVNPLDIYEEKVSGVAKHRPQFEAMMKDARQGDIVVVWKLDRLGRSVRQVLDTVAKLDAKGARLKVLTQPIDTTTTLGRLILTILAAVAEMERDLIRERSIEGQAAGRRRGRHPGRVPKHSDEVVLEAARLGTKPGARKLGMSPVGFMKAVARARAKAIEEGTDGK